MRMYNPGGDLYEASVHSERPDYRWSAESFCLAEVCRRFGLPQVIQYDQRGSHARIVNFDLAQPLVAYSARAVRKVCARGLSDTAGHVSEPIIIPQDYKGWFNVLRPGCVTPYYTAINSIALSNVTSFLVASRLPGFQVVHETGKYIQRYILPGEILTVSRTYIGTKKVKEKYIFKRRKSVEVRYLMCLDATEREILFSLDQKGSFYAVTVSNKAQSTCCILRMSDILQKLHFPVDVRLVFGRKPMSSSTIPSDLRLNASFMDDSVVAMTMGDAHNIFLELPKLNSPLRFKVASKSVQLTRSTVFTRTLGMCEEGVDTYMKDIKVSLTSAVNDQHYYDSLNSLDSNDTREYSGITKGHSTPSIYRDSCSPVNKTVNTSSPDLRDTLPSPLKKRSPIIKLFTKDRCKSLDTNISKPACTWKTKVNKKVNNDGEDYEYIWNKNDKPPIRRRKENNGIFKGSTSMDSINDSTKCRLSFEGTYIILRDEFLFSQKPPTIGVSTSLEQRKAKLTGRNSLETVAETWSKNKRTDYVNLDALTRSSSESTLALLLGNSNEHDYKNLSDLSADPPVCTSDKTTDADEFYATLKRVRPVEQALRVSVYGDIEGWDVVGDPATSDTQCSHDSGYISMNDLDGCRASRDLSDTNKEPTVGSRLPAINLVAETQENDDHHDSVYVSMNELRDDYTNAKPTLAGVEKFVDMAINKSEGVTSDGCSDCDISISPTRSTIVIKTKSVQEIAAMLRCCGIRETIVEQFVKEKVDGQLLTSLDLSIIQETFPDLRAIEAKKVWMMVKDGWLPNETR